MSWIFLIIIWVVYLGYGMYQINRDAKNIRREQPGVFITIDKDGISAYSTDPRVQVSVGEPTGSCDDMAVKKAIIRMDAQEDQKDE